MFALPFMRRRSRHRPIPILAYHALNAPDKDYASNDHVALEEDLKLVRKLGFKVARLAEIAEFTWNRAPSRLDSEQWIGLSFDDGTDFDYLDIEAHPYLGYVKSFYTILKESGTGDGRDGLAGDHEDAHGHDPEGAGDRRDVGREGAASFERTAGREES